MQQVYELPYQSLMANSTQQPKYATESVGQIYTSATDIFWNLKTLTGEDATIKERKKEKRVY